MPLQELAKLQAIAADASARTVDQPGQLAAAVHEALASSADPMLLLGVLIEGAVVTIRERVPREKRAECLAAVTLMLSRRVPG